MADGLDRDTARALAGICRDCPEPALDGGLGAKCLAKAASQRKRQRQGRADAGICIEAGCGRRVEKVLREDGSAVQRRCAPCARKLNTGRRSIRRSVTGGGRSVTGGGVDLDETIAAVRPGDERTLLITVEVPRALLLAAVEADIAPAPCGHRVCSRDDGRTFCVVNAIKNAHRLPQMDGEAPADRGARLGNEYALTVEQIAQLVGVSTRAIEQSLASALRKLADTKAGEYLRRLVGD